MYCFSLVVDATSDFWGLQLRRQKEHDYFCISSLDLTELDVVIPYREHLRDFWPKLFIDRGRCWTLPTPCISALLTFKHFSRVKVLSIGFSQGNHELWAFNFPQRRPNPFKTSPFPVDVLLFEISSTCLFHSFYAFLKPYYSSCCKNLALE